MRQYNRILFSSQTCPKLHPNPSKCLQRRQAIYHQSSSYSNAPSFKQNTSSPSDKLTLLDCHMNCPYHHRTNKDCHDAPDLRINGDDDLSRSRHRDRGQCRLLTPSALTFSHTTSVTILSFQSSFVHTLSNPVPDNMFLLVRGDPHVLLSVIEVFKRPKNKTRVPGQMVHQREA